MFRRFRQRLALRAMEKKKKKLRQQSKRSDESTSRLTTTIFRSIDSTTTFQNIPSVRTVGSSFGGSGDHEVDDVKRIVPPTTPSADTSPATTSPNDDTSSISCTSFAKGVLLVGGVDLNKDEQALKEPLLVDTTHSQVLQQMVALSGPLRVKLSPTHHHNHKRSSSCTSSTAKENLRNVLDEVHSEIFGSEQMKEELFATQIQLAFFKESHDELEKELHQKDAVIQRQHLELLLGRKIMTYTKNELSNTKTAFQESVLTLVDMKMTLLSLHDQLNQQQLELLTLKEKPMATIQ